MNLNSILHNHNLNGISPEKLNFLLTFASQNPSGNTKEMTSTLMKAMSTAKKKNLEFTSNETEVLVELLKQNMSPEEQKKADQLMALMKSMKKS